MPATRALRLGGAIALLAVLVTPALSGPIGGAHVRAHAQLVASSPGSGAVLPAPPAEIRLVFSEPLESQVTSLDMETQDGTPVLTRAGEVDPADPYALVVANPNLDDGLYLVTWRTLSAADGHTAEGSLSFGIGDVEGTLVSQSGGGMVHSETDPIGVVGRWLTYVGLMLALGIAVFHRVVIPNEAMPWVLVRGLGAGLVVSGLAGLVAAAASGAEAGSIGDYLTASRNGILQLARAVVALGGGAALLVVRPRLVHAVAAASGLTGIVLLVLAGHASALPGPAPVVSGVVHVGAAAIWIGGIAALLALALRPALLTAHVPPPMRTFVPRFSALAMASIGLVVLTGVYAAYVQTGVLIDTGTEYGRTLLMKAGFAAGALGLGGLNYLDGGRMMGWLDGFRSRITVEFMLATTVLVLTAALAITPPVEEPGGVRIEPIPDAFGNVAPDMSMSIIPGRPGLNRVVVTTTDALAASSTLELALDRLDVGSTTRVPLILEAMAGMDHAPGLTGMAGMEMATADGTVDWTADAVVLPAGSQWDTSVRILPESGDTEISRQRFAYTLSDDAISEGAATTVVNPATLVAGTLLLGGALGIGLGLGGAVVPRCEPAVSRLALIGGGGVAAALGAIIGVSVLVA